MGLHLRSPCCGVRVAANTNEIWKLIKKYRNKYNKKNQEIPIIHILWIKKNYKYAM